MKWLMTLCLILLMSDAVYANTEKWSLSSQYDGISVYNSAISLNNRMYFRGEMILLNEINEIAAVLEDIELMPFWFDRLSYGKILSYKQNKPIIYFVVNGIWPARDRDMVVGLSKVTLADGVVQVRFATGNTQIPEQPCCVRVKFLESIWQLKPLSEGRTKVTLSMSSDPGGLVPIWLANVLATNVPRATLENLRLIMSSR